MKKLLLLLLLSLVVLSCDLSREGRMSSKFKKEYKKRMNDPSFLEVASITITREAKDYNERNKKIINGLIPFTGSKGTSYYLENFDKIHKITDSINAIELSKDKYFKMVQTIIRVRQKNRFGAKELEYHRAYFCSCGKDHLLEIDNIYIRSDYDCLY